MRLMLFLLVYLNAVHTDLSVYRKLMDASLEDKTQAQRFYDQLKTVKETDDPVLLGFRAMSEFMLCKHLFNPVSKLSHFKKGRNMLEMAIKRAHTSPELLFFRLSTQSNVPSILGYSDHIMADKSALISYLQAGVRSEQDKALYKRVKDYLLINKYCSAEEKAVIKKL
jgi:hypothetical protein